MLHISESVRAQMSEKMKRPEGTFGFTAHFEGEIGDPSEPGGIVLEQISGQHYFRLVRDDQAEIAFYYSSPGTGTRVAHLDAKPLRGNKDVIFILTWSPKEIGLDCGVKGGDVHLQASGEPSPIQFRVGTDGSLMEIAAFAMGSRLTSLGRQIVKPTAIQAWEETKEAIKIHQTGTSTEGFMFEVVSANMALCMMVTGFEAYCKTRFEELEQEGIAPQMSARISDYKKVNFQDFGAEAKRAYKDAYGVDFNELGLTHEEMAKLKQAFAFRHRIIHASPLIAHVNELAKKHEPPVFSGVNYQAEVLGLFDKFIEKLHQATSVLRPAS